MSRDTGPKRAAAHVLAISDPDHPLFSASEEVEAALRTLAPWLDSWVRPHLRYAAGLDESYRGERADLRAQVDEQPQRAEAHKRWKAHRSGAHL